MSRISLVYPDILVPMISNKPFSFILVDVLQCNKCFFDTSLNTSSCNTTTEHCSEGKKFCATIWQERQDGSISFSRECFTSEVCTPGYCENVVIPLYGRKSCNVTQCCQEDLCNEGTTVKKGHDTTVKSDHDTTVKSDHVTQFYWSLDYHYLIAVALALRL